MRFSSRLAAHAWILVLLGALAFLAWTNARRAQRLLEVTRTDAEEAVIDPQSPTGYAGGKRWLIVPEHRNESYRLIADTQRMLGRHEWRLRHVDDENAPQGRAVYSPSPYRWWLGFLAWLDHATTGRPLAGSVERAALWSDPALHALLLVLATGYVAWRLGGQAAALLAAGVAALFPFAAGFLPGAPDDAALARVLAFASVVLLLDRPRTARRDSAGPAAPAPRARAGRFAVAGVLGGLGLWVAALDEAVVIAGIGLGALLASWLEARHRRRGKEHLPASTPWRVWALAGATTSLLAYLGEYAPAHLGLRLGYNHPLYGLAWLGLGELLTLAEHRFRHGAAEWRRGPALRLALSLAGIAALPAVMMASETLALTAELSASRLTSLPNGAVARNFAVWIVRDGLTGPVLATCLSLLLIGPALVVLASGTRRPIEQRGNVALALGPTLIVLGFGFSQLAWWSLFDALLLVLLVAVFAAPGAGVPAGRRPWLWPVLAAGVLLAGVPPLRPLPMRAGELAFTRAEVEDLLERTIAHWIADRADPEGAVVLLPPYRTMSACFHGGFRGLGSDRAENREGLAATIRIVAATSPEEAQALLVERGITHLVLPSWDADLDQFARWMHSNPEDAFISALHHWALPVWLRPLPYRLPQVAGFENESVVILQVTDETNRAAALSRLVEYFIEMQQYDLARGAEPALARYPADLNALLALAQVQKISGDADGQVRTFAALVTAVAGGMDRALAWDRRLSLAFVLAEGKRSDLARAQLEQCLQRIDARRLRALTTGSLARLEMLTQVLGRPIPDPGLRELARRLLPPELRAQLQ